MSGKETKLGLGVIALLLIVLCVVLVRRMWGTGEAPPAQVKGAQQTGPALSGGPSKPTMLQTKNGNALPPNATEKKRETPWSASKHDDGYDDPAKPRMPKGDLGSGLKNAAGAKGSVAKAPQLNDARSASSSSKYGEPKLGSPGSQAVAGDRDDGGSSRRYDFYGGTPEPSGASRYSSPSGSPYEEQHYRADDARAGQYGVSSRGYGDYGASQNDGRYAGGSNNSYGGGYGDSRGSGYGTPAMPASTPAYGGYGSGAVHNPYADAGYGGAAQLRENTGKYYVEPGDSFWLISQKVYGDGGYFKALAEHNKRRFPESYQLNIGDEIITPEAAALREKYPSLCPKERVAKRGTPRATQVSAHLMQGTRQYLVEEGDTLYDIAKYELDDAARWPEIYQLNRQVLGDDIDYLRPGTRILLPGPKTEQPAGAADAASPGLQPLGPSPAGPTLYPSVQPGDRWTREPSGTYRR